MKDQTVETQIIANLVVRNTAGQVLLVRYDPDNEKWWLPGGDVEPFTHPDETAARVLAAFEGLTVSEQKLHHLESFRGRRGWHFVVHYAVTAEGTVKGPQAAAWFAPDDLPKTMHGAWEKQAIATVLENTA